MTQSLSGVLLVEDDEGDALLVRECLREAGLADDDVTWCRTLAEGVEALAERPSCVLLDLGLPDAEGLEALHTVVAEVTTTPVIVLTGRHDRTGVEAVAAGAQDYLIKDDLTPELLDRTIRYAVQRRQAQLTEFQLREERLLAAENSRLEKGLLPRPLLRTDFVSCASHYRPGRARAVLGGDFFDVVETADGRVRAVIGDVMGHGPDEAALGVHLRVAWRALVLADVPDDQILSRSRGCSRPRARAASSSPSATSRFDRDLVAGRSGSPATRRRCSAPTDRRATSTSLRAAARHPRRAGAARVAGHPDRAARPAPRWCSTPTVSSTPTAGRQPDQRRPRRAARGHHRARWPRASRWTQLLATVVGRAPMQAADDTRDGGAVRAGRAA